MNGRYLPHWDSIEIIISHCEPGLNGRPQYVWIHITLSLSFHSNKKSASLSLSIYEHTRASPKSTFLRLSILYMCSLHIHIQRLENMYTLCSIHLHISYNICLLPMVHQPDVHKMWFIFSCIQPPLSSTKSARSRLPCRLTHLSGSYLVLRKLVVKSRL